MGAVGIWVPAPPPRRTGPWWFLVRPDAADLAIGRVPDRDPMAPPQLPADAPVVHIVDPVEVARGQVRRGGPHPAPPPPVPPGPCPRPPPSRPTPPPTR